MITKGDDDIYQYLNYAMIIFQSALDNCTMRETVSCATGEGEKCIFIIDRNKTKC